jgi:hypothetical protein
MVSALLMLRRVVATFRYAVREEDFLNIFGAGVALAIIGTISYTLGATGIPSTRSTSRWRR